jgi:uncharacterized protein (DUF2062 family)
VRKAVATRFGKLWRHLRDEHTEPHRLGLAVALGLFVGCLPLYGIHLGICIALAWALRLNKATVYLAANISNPFFAPVLVAAGIGIGEWIRFGFWRPLDLSAGHDFVSKPALFSGQLPDMFVSCLLGDAVLGVALAAGFGPAVWLWARWRKGRREAPD